MSEKWSNDPMSIETPSNSHAESSNMVQNSQIMPRLKKLEEECHKKDIFIRRQAGKIKLLAGKAFRLRVRQQESNDKYEALKNEVDFLKNFMSNQEGFQAALAAKAEAEAPFVQEPNVFIMADTDTECESDSDDQLAPST